MGAAQATSDVCVERINSGMALSELPQCKSSPRSCWRSVLPLSPNKPPPVQTHTNGQSCCLQTARDRLGVVVVVGWSGSHWRAWPMTCSLFPPHRLYAEGGFPTNTRKSEYSPSTKPGTSALFSRGSLSSALPLAAGHHLQEGLSCSPEPGRGRAHTSANRSSCWTGSVGSAQH